MTRCDDCPPNLRAGWVRNTVLATVTPVPVALIVKCAWCLREAHEAPNPEHSHGICPMHAAQVRAQIAGRKG